MKAGTTRAREMSEIVRNPEGSSSCFRPRHLCNDRHKNKHPDVAIAQNQIRFLTFIVEKAHSYSVHRVEMPRLRHETPPASAFWVNGGRWRESVDSREEAVGLSSGVMEPCFYSREEAVGQERHDPGE
ncbi:hypothetical protein E4U56_001335 [Claviceps arundinis]|uniref:Uncharacterized protein n=1 Tax=Claviceps arundinis TaxID=1623583 RepID=A0A9P7SMW6_9HYPO|nr:hypothetical protein E4U56_001335 [Claviceps arundinis]